MYLSLITSDSISILSITAVRKNFSINFIVDTNGEHSSSFSRHLGWIWTEETQAKINKTFISALRLNDNDRAFLLG